jgi:hypothetical protein
VSSIPAIGADGTIYVGSWDGFFYALNPDGTLKWKFETLKEGESITSSAAIGADGTIYVCARDGFRAINPDGTSKWHYEGKIGGVVSAPAIGSDGTIYVGSWDGNLYAFGGTSQVEEPLVEDTAEVEDETQIDEDLGEAASPTKEIPITYVIGSVVLVVVGIVIVLRKRIF